jgi:uncharacterized protein (TIGR02466 family)
VNGSTNMSVHNLFPVPVGTCKIDRPLTKTEEEFILSQETVENLGNLTSVDTYILDRKKMKGVRRMLQSHLDYYFRNLFLPRVGVKLRITQSWLNYTSPKGFHHKHAHPNSYISGVFYVKAKKEFDKIHFTRTMYEPFKLNHDEWNMYNSETWWLSVESGDLLLFPSNIFHSVEAVQSDETRISLAFNSYFVGSIGEERALSELILQG